MTERDERLGESEKAVFNWDFITALSNFCEAKGIDYLITSDETVIAEADGILKFLLGWR